MKTSIALFLALASAATPLAAQDTIKFKDPKKNPDLQGEIVNLAFDLVEIEVFTGNGAVKQAVDPRLIAEFVPGRRSLDFLKGEETLAAGDAVSAAARFDRVANDTQATPLLRQLAAVKAVRAHFSE